MTRRLEAVKDCALPVLPTNRRCSLCLLALLICVEIGLGFGYDMVYINGIPRIGNRYGHKDQWESWEPRFDFSLIPIQLKAGKNEFLFKCMRGRFKAKFSPPKNQIMFNKKAITLPDFIVGEEIDKWGAIVVMNATTANLDNIYISSSIGNNPVHLTPLSSSLS